MAGRSVDEEIPEFLVPLQHLRDATTIPQAHF